MNINFNLSTSLCTAQLAEDFALDGKVQVRGLLAGDAAEQLHTQLRLREDWRQVINSGSDKLVELDRQMRESLSPEQRQALDQAVYADARAGFQYRYETIRIPDDEEDRSATEDSLAAFASWLSRGEAREFLRQVTGQPDIRFADAQATSYSPGDFLTGHDDAVEGKGRIAAYVFNLTPEWRLEWGGLLLFHEDAERRASALVPSFNTLNVFRVPQSHSVSEVTRAAAYRRYSITGWLRR